MRAGKRFGVLLGGVALLTMVAQTAWAETPILWNLEVKGGGFIPGIDEEEGLTGAPYQTVYGDESSILLMSELGVQVYRGTIGTFALQGGLGFFSKDGKSVDPESGEQPGDQTTLEILPTHFSVAYHFNYLAEELNVPFVFVAKYGFDYWAWWFLNSDGNLARADEKEGSGSTMGTHYALGVKFLLDWIDPSSAQTFDSDVGVNRSYLMAEYMRADVNDFGSDTSMNLGGDTFLFGIAFEM